MRRLFLVTVALLLSACSHLSTDPDPFDSTVAIYSWTLEGKMHFRCDYDDQGFSWKFVDQSGTLYDDQHRQVGTISGNVMLRLADGSVAMGHIEKRLTPATTQHAGDVRYIVGKSTDTGKLRGARYFTRLHTKSGMPLAACSAAQRDNTLKIPFTARFVVYR